MGGKTDSSGSRTKKTAAVKPAVTKAKKAVAGKAGKQDTLGKAGKSASAKETAGKAKNVPAKPVMTAKAPVPKKTPASEKKPVREEKPVQEPAKALPADRKSVV